MALRLKLSPELMRSKGFLAELADCALRNSMPIEIEGSVLSHAYYILSRTHVHIRCVDPFRPKPKVRKFEKLVRDYIPVKIQARGETVMTCSVERRQLLHLLKAKAVEEALELYWEQDPDRSLTELADIYEVVESLVAALEHDFGSLVQAVREKREKRGAFRRGVVLLETREIPLIQDSIQEALFDHDVLEGEIGDAGARRISSVRSRISLAGTPRKSGKEIVIPLVPPDEVPGSEYCFPILNDELEVVVQYQNMEARVSVRPIEQRANDAAQLPLF
jgi:predicted house-cleaning noncanonical NTP pyrophosphatase (MazG superfamily)